MFPQGGRNPDTKRGEPPGGCDTMEDRRSRLRRAAAGLEGTHRLTGATAGAIANAR